MPALRETLDQVGSPVRSSKKMLGAVSGWIHARIAELCRRVQARRRRSAVSGLDCHKPGLGLRDGLPVAGLVAGFFWQTGATGAAFRGFARLSFDDYARAFSLTARYQLESAISGPSCVHGRSCVQPFDLTRFQLAQLERDHSWCG